MKRTVLLPLKGRVLISTDLHGNMEDFLQLEQLFLTHFQKDPLTQWVLLGDIVHGPNAQTREEAPGLYGEDHSFSIVERLVSLQNSHHGHVHFVLGNHDYGHIGGAHTSKFYPDEVAALEQRLSAEERTVMHHFFSNALLAVIAPCGIWMSHGCPDDSLVSLAQLDMKLPPVANADAEVLRPLLTAYGQPDRIARAMLRNVSRELFPDGEHSISVIVHGHDRDESGYFTEGETQICPVIFGACKKNKRYLLIDLSKPYTHTSDFREDIEILRLYSQP